MIVARTSLLLLLIASPVLAQTPPAAPPPGELAARRAVEYGVRFGIALTSLTSVETFDATSVGAAREPTMNFGGFVTVHLAGPLAFQPEVLFSAKGQRIHDKDAAPIVTGTGTKPPEADRVVLLRYLEIPLLVRVSRQTRPETSVYLIGGPALAFRRGAVIREVANPGRLEDIADMVTGGNFSLVFGAGLQHARWLVDARFTRGLRNVAVAPQPAEVKTGGFAVLLGARF